MKRYFPGTTSPMESDRERAHRQIVRRAAAESIVLLKNEDVLPLEAGTKVALYGLGAKYTIKGGSGSGSVNNRSQVSIYEGLKEAGFVITNEAWLSDYDAKVATARQEWIDRIYQIANEDGGPGDFTSLYRAHASNPMPTPKGDAFAKTDSEVAIYVISRTSGEGADRKEVKGDYYLSEDEYQDIKELRSLYAKLIVILNVGGIIDLSFADEFAVDAIIYLSQAGMEGGNALADVLCGLVNPSGKLTDTWAYQYKEYPSSASFSHNNGNLYEEKYEEGIFVGYRYFDTFGLPVRYPFGYGLSYTEFQIDFQGVTLEAGRCKVKASVKNIGNAPGKEVVQIYASCPDGRLTKEMQRLVGFSKTGLIATGETEEIEVTFDLALLESYHTGKAIWLMEEGIYYLFGGNSSRNTVMIAGLSMGQTVITEQMKNVCPLQDALKELKVSEERRDTKRKQNSEEFIRAGLSLIELDSYICVRERAIQNEVTDQRIEDILKTLTLEEKAILCCGRQKGATSEIIGNAGITVPGAAGETAAILEERYGIKPVVMADGPAGIRLQARYQENPEDHSIYGMTGYQALQNRLFGTEFLHEGAIDHYQYCTAIPVGTLLAQSFDLDLMRELGKMIAVEMQEFGVGLWLAPGMNIHRNPLCGRNFEYFSEDPLVSGKMAAAITEGVQSLAGCGTTIKHYACNNQEENRRGVSSIVSERALREIYLKGFEIAIKEAQPAAIMTSYNKINGVHTANSRDLCTVLAREEWGFEGIIMTDWTTTNTDGGSSAAKCVAVGNDLTMPGQMSDIKEIIDAVNQENDLSLDEKLLDDCVRRILRYAI